MSRFTSVITRQKGALADKLPKSKISLETIESVREDGRFVIQGYVVSTTGIKLLQVGERVPVLWEIPAGGIEFIPKVIIGHSWRRAQGVFPVEEVAVSDLEIAFEGEIDGVEGFYIAGETGIFAVDPEDPGFSTIGISWGTNANILLLEFFGTEGKVLRVERINRGIESKKLPVKVDEQGDVVLFKTTSVPVLQTTKVFERKIFDDISLGKTLTVRENLHVDSFVDIIRADTFQDPGANFETLVPKFGGVTPFDFVIEQTIQLNLDSSLVGFRYNVLFLHAFADSKDEIIAYYRINWKLNSVIDRSNPVNQRIIDIFMAHTPPFPLPNPTLFINQGAFSVVNSITSSFQRHTAFEAIASPYPTFARLALGKVRIKSANNIPNASSFFDVVAINLTTGQVVGASFTNPVFEWDRDLVAAIFTDFRRVHLHLSTSTSPFDFDLVLNAHGTSTEFEKNFLGQFTGFFGVGEYPLESPPGFLIPTGFKPDTIRNLRFSGRAVGGFASLRDELPFDETVTPTIVFTIPSAFFGDPLNLPGDNSIIRSIFNFTLPVAAVALKPGVEHDFTVKTPDDIDTPRVSNGKPTLAALRTIDIPSDLRGIKVLKWTLPSTLAFPFSEKTGAGLGLSDLQANDLAIFLEVNGSKFIVLNADAERIVESAPENLKLILPQRFTNDEDDDRRFYKITIDPDTNTVTITQTTKPATDLTQKKEGTIVSEASFHLVTSIS